jgi:hypothetical protein
MKVDMLVWMDEEDGMGNIGSFILKGGKVEVVPTVPEYRRMLDAILKRKLRDRNGKRWGVGHGAAHWLRLLPLNYDGARMRADLSQ